MESTELFSPSPSPALNETLQGGTYLVITSNRVTDSQLTTSLWLNTVLGISCFLIFCVLQRSVVPKHYRYRMKSNSVTVKPRHLPSHGFKSYWYWLKVAITSSDAELMRSCGYDAVVMIKALSTGVKIFLPLALIGCGVLLPIHYKYRSLDNQDINRSQLMQLTIAALPRGSNLMWVHFILIVVYNCWVMWVLFGRYKEFVIVRQHYLVKGDDPNYWLQATRNAEAEAMKKKVQKILAEINGEVNKNNDPGDQLSPIDPGRSVSPEPNVRDSAQSGLRSMVGKVGQSWSNMFSWRSRGNPLRSSHESYKPYTDDNTPAISPPITSPQASAIGVSRNQHSGLGRARSGGAGGVSSDGLESGGESSQSDSLGMPATVAAANLGPALTLSAGMLEANAAAGSHSGGSSRRWSGSSGGASEGASAARGSEVGSSADFSRRLRAPKQPGKGRTAAAVAGGGAPPTHETINELQSLTLQGAMTPPLSSSLSDQPFQWPSIPKHMRTITEDSLEYRLDSSQGNNSRPSSRGGLLAGSIGHNRASSAGTGDLAASRPSSASGHSRAQASALSASLAAAGDSSNLSHRHSHSHSGGSATGGAATGSAPASNTMMSPLSRTSSAQPVVMRSSSNSGQQQPGIAGVQEPVMLSGRASVDSVGPCSVCTRITHDTSSGRSSPADDGSYNDASSRQSTPARGRSSRGSSPETSNTADSSFVSAGVAAVRDLSFGGMAQLEQQRLDRLGVGAGLNVLGVDSGQVHLSGLAAGSVTGQATPETAQRPHHGYQTSVDFGALHLEDLSRPETPLSPEGGFISPQQRPSRVQRNRGDSTGGRWSPFANSEQLATTIAAGGVANTDDFWSVGVQRMQGVQSHPVEQAPAGSGAQQPLPDGSNKERFVRPGPGWQPPSAGGAVQQLGLGSAVGTGQSQQQAPGMQGASGPAAPANLKSAATLRGSEEQPDTVAQLHTQPHASLVISGNVASGASSAATSRVSSGTTLQGLHARAQRQRVMPRNISTAAGGPSGRNSSEPSPGQAGATWTGSGWQPQPTKGSNSGATSHSGIGSSFITPRDTQAVAGAAIGAGQELVAPALALMSPGPAMKTLADVALRLQNVANMSEAEEEEVEYISNNYRRATRVVNPWWKTLDEADYMQYDDDGKPIAWWLGLNQEEAQAWLETRPLHKPSVRYRKTINVWSREKMGYTGVMAQHYAVLVTDVDQWLYPELQEDHEAQLQRTLPYKAWMWVLKLINALPQRMPWATLRQLPQLQEQQHLLLQQQQEGVGMSDKQSFELPPQLPDPAVLEAAVEAGGTSGGASVVVSRSSRGHGRGQMSSCATSSEGFGAGVGAANSLARASYMSHATQHSYLPGTDAGDPVGFLAVAEQDLAVAKQQVLQSLDKPAAAHTLAKIEKAQAEVSRFTERQQALSREQSAYQLHPPSRSTSYLRLGVGPLGASGAFGQAGQAPAGWANQLASRASSIRSMQHFRAEQAVAGAAVGVPELTQKPQLPGSLPSRAQTPSSMHADSDIEAGTTAGPPGIGAGPLTKERLDTAMAIMHTHREQQQLRRRHGTGLQQQWSYSEATSPRLRQSSTDTPTAYVRAVPAGAFAGVTAGFGHLEQTHSEPVTVAATPTAHELHRHALGPPARSSLGGHPLLVGDLSVEQPLASSTDAGSHGPAAAAAGPTAEGDESSADAAQAVGYPVPHHHRRYIYRSASPSGSPEGLAREAELSRTPSPGSQIDDGDRGWSSSPASPNPAHGPQVGPGQLPKLRTLASSVSVSNSRPISKSAGGASAVAAGSYDSNASSLAARRQMVSFMKPYPPDSPMAREQQQAGFGSIVLVDGQPGSHQQQLRSSLAFRSVGRLATSGGSGGGLPPGALPLQASGRSRSDRLSNSQLEGSSGPNSGGSYHNPDHLCLLIPPTQQVPISRGTTPRGSNAGYGGSSGGLRGSGGGAPVHLPPAPWGLPPDAALITSSISAHTAAGSPADGLLRSSSLRHRVAATPRGARWSASGLPAERSMSNLGNPLHSHLSSDHTDAGLIPAVGVVPVNNDTAQATTATSAVDSEALTAIADYYAADPKAALAAEDGSMQAGGSRGWDIVREAFNDKKNKPILKLLESDSYSVVTATFKRLFPEDFDKAIPVINHKKVDLLLMQWEATVAELNRAQLKLQRTGVPPTRFRGRLGQLFSCCTSMGCGCKGWKGRTWLFGWCLGNSVVEIIPEIEERLQQLELEIEVARREAFRSGFTPSWFVLFKSQKAASIAASTRIYAEDNNKFQVHPAPGPEEVNWQHLWMSYKERDLRAALTWPLMLLVVLFPITLVTSAASRLEYVFCPDATDPDPAFVWEWYCTGKETGSALPSFIRALFTGWLPSLLLNLWLTMVLPRLVYLIVQAEGSCFSLSALERRIGAVFYLWDVFNVFLQGTIGSTFFQQVRRIIQTPDQLPNILGAALPDASNFFMQFIAMRALFLVWLRLCVPHGGVWQNWCHYCFCPAWCCSTCNTDRDKSLNYGPRTPRYGFEMGHILMMYLIGLAFAIVSPLLLPFSVAWFMFAWIAWRHNLYYVYQRKYESGGLMWIFLFSRIVMCMFIGQLFTFCVLVVKGAYWQAFLTITFLPAMTAKFYRYCQARFARGIEYGVPLDMADRAYRTSGSVVPSHVYIPPPLQDQSHGWYPEWNKIWDGWGMPAYAAL